MLSVPQNSLPLANGGQVKPPPIIYCHLHRKDECESQTVFARDNSLSPRIDDLCPSRPSLVWTSFLDDQGYRPLVGHQCSMQNNSGSLRICYVRDFDAFSDEVSEITMIHSDRCEPGFVRVVHWVHRGVLSCSVIVHRAVQRAFIMSSATSSRHQEGREKSCRLTLPCSHCSTPQ